jgi:hypothetical protein
MNSTITYTPTTNIKDNSVVDDKLVRVLTYDGRMDVFTFFNIKSKETRRSNLMDVSLYDDEIVEDDIHYKILHMLSKG